MTRQPRCNRPHDGKPKDECGIFGIYGNERAANLTYLGLYALQHRGQESSGIASSDGHHIYRYAGMGKVVDIFTAEHLEHLQGHMAIGHNRYSTTGSSFLRNAQPFRSESILGPIVLAHNGNLTNAGSLRYDLERKGHIFQTTIDSEVIVHLMAKSGIDDFMDALVYALKQVRGAYSLLVMNRDRMYAVRDPYGFRPLVLGKLGSAHVVASETCAFDIIDARYEREVEPGEVLEISDAGIRSFRPFEKRDQSLCVFEYIYFSRPDSTIFGRSVYDMRIRLGRMLARQAPVKAEVVVPIPDSSVCAAVGYSRESGIPYELGLIRSHYIGRTFIEPSQKIRDFGAKIKYNVVKEAVAGKKIIVVDDSIMRGTTMRKIIKMFRNAGATEIHVRISAPPTLFPCFYGIDIPTRKELIAATHSIEEIRKYLRVDSIQYLTVETLLAALNEPDMHFCTACFDGSYPCELDENGEDNQKYLFEDSEISEYY
ncbi:MAG TPA: amidophosphoribosyltransferase [Spirochaetota bacterium]|nr:amidophosphoribosyltransferase [Spirochaetota bacterium]HPC42006.1 amidophosphoribosyltransferase [Spirochaetota bacterium]HPL17636.1 amidophosphoribosyltransferase [Spirochaetota bacterium]HQF09523.1 amidophosphoribosyltransferase [Spirochaetota bacterium]HQH98407.1 amidophosphoribosyltransferase [Spirochaetota bacterium]